MFHTSSGGSKNNPQQNNYQFISAVGICFPFTFSADSGAIPVSLTQAFTGTCMEPSVSFPIKMSGMCKFPLLMFA